MKPFLFLRYALYVALAVAAVPSWAAELSAPGVPNFHQVDARLFRGGQPTDQGWQSLAALGVKTIVDLRRVGEHSAEAESLAVLAAGMRYVNVPMNGFETPRNEQITKILNLLTSTTEPAFIHCKLGKDRTGTVVAAYRIAHDRWENKRALDEALDCGMQWFSRGMKRFIQDYQPAGDVVVLEPAASER